MRLGIDFGTTRTVVAAALDGNYPIASFGLPDGYRTWVPTVAAWDGRAFRFGEDALPLLRSGTVRGVRSVKRLLGDLGTRGPDDPVPGIDGPPTGALELATAFLVHLKEELRTRSNLDVGDDEPLEAMVAVPANAGSRQRFLTLEAFAAAGFEVLGMVNEPSAAAIEFAHRDQRVLNRRSPKRYVVVYDLGGGTFDTSAVSLLGQRFELLVSEGIARLGGDDVDEAILDLWCEAEGVPRASLAAPAEGALLEVCRRAKEALTPQSKRLFLDPEVALPLPPTVLDVASLYERCEPLVDRTLALLEEVFGGLPEEVDREDPRRLGAVYLVGGAAAFPAVQRALKNRHKRKVRLAPTPHAATAVGLAVAADPAAGVRVREATTRYFGVWREAEAGRETVFDPLLRKDQLPGEDRPLVVERSYRPAHTVGHLRYVECTRLDASGRPTGDLSPFGELYFPYDPALVGTADLAAVDVERRPELGAQEIVERYSYQRDGTIAVQILNRTTGYARSLRFATA